MFIRLPMVRRLRSVAEPAHSGFSADPLSSFAYLGPDGKYFFTPDLASVKRTTVGTTLYAKQKKLKSFRRIADGKKTSLPHLPKPARTPCGTCATLTTRRNVSRRIVAFTLRVMKPNHVSNHQTGCDTQSTAAFPNESPGVARSPRVHAAGSLTSNLQAPQDTDLELALWQFGFGPVEADGRPGGREAISTRRVQEGIGVDG